MNFQRQKRHAAERGFLSIEVMVVLVVVISLLALGASKMGLLGSSASNVEEISNVQTLYTVAKATKGSSGYGAAGTNIVPTLVANGTVPKNMTLSGGIIYNQWGGSVTVVSTGPGFSITLNSVPPGECSTIASKLSRSGTFTSTQINGNAAVAGEIVAATAATQCNNATANSVMMSTAS